MASEEHCYSVTESEYYEPNDEYNVLTSFMN